MYNDRNVSKWYNLLHANNMSVNDFLQTSHKIILRTERYLERTL